MNSEKIHQSARFNKYGYAVFLLAGLVFLFLKNYSNAVIFLGLAPLFDPFNPAVKFNHRPLWQRLWLVVHAGVTLFAVYLSIKYFR